MAKKNEKVFTISVVGLSGTEKEKGAIGVGKSCLCNRFVRPHEDEFSKEHISVLSQSDFGGRVVNNDHFLYWGEVIKKSDDEDIVFQVIEQTEFIDDTSFQPLRGTNTNAYFKRSTATKLTSAEKLMYICKYQLGLESEYEQKPLPDGKINVDGFLCVFDVSSVPNRSLEQQIKFLDQLFSQLTRAKKPIVIALTKCDESMDHYKREAEKYAQSKKVPHVETSANENVNVETAFMVLAQNIDKRVKSKNVSYQDASKHQKQIIDSVSDSYTAMLKSNVTNYHTLWKTTKNKFEKEKDFRRYVEVLGEKRARLTFQRHIRRLQDEHLTRKLLQYLKALPNALGEVLPDINEISGKEWAECHELIRQSPHFEKWFIDLPDGISWKESEHIHRDDDSRIPFDVLTRNLTETEASFRTHINKLHAQQRKARMKVEFKKLLEQTGTIKAGQPYDEVTIFLMEYESFRELNDKEKKEIFDAHQKELAESAKEEFRELLLEHSELFAKLDPNKKMHKEDLKNIHDSLKRETRYAALNYLEDDRNVLVLRHIGFIQSPTRETCLSGENCIDNLVEKCFDSNAHRPSSWNRRASYIEANNKLNLVLLGEDGLADELANEIRAQSCEEDYTLDGNIYSLDLRPIEGNVLLPAHDFRTPTFMPSACICVYTTKKSLEYVEDSLQKTVLPVDDKKPAFPGLPLAVIFAREMSNSDAENTDLRSSGQLLADRLQSVFIDIPTDPLWHGKKFHESQITQALRAIIATIRFRSGLGDIENNREYMDPDIKIQLCMMCDDPYPADLVLGPLVNHQCCWINPDKAQTIVLDTFLGSEKRKVEVMAVSYHQGTPLREELHHGYILAYSTKRKASFSMLKAFSHNVLHVPIMMLAVTESADFFSDEDTKKYLTAGNKLADNLNIKFITTSSKFRQQTAVFTPFFKEAYDKKADTEAQFKMRRSLSMENIRNSVDMSRRPPAILPKRPHTMSRQKSVSGADGDHPGKGRYSTTPRDPLDMLYSTAPRGRRPPKPPRDQSLRHSLRSQPPEPEEGWVDNDVYESVDTKSQPRTPRDNQSQSGWVQNDMYESAGPNVTPPGTIPRRQPPPPKGEKPPIPKKPGKLNIGQFEKVNESLKHPREVNVRTKAPLATPEDDYAFPKDTLRPNRVAANKKDEVYSEVQDALLPGGKKVRVHTKKQRPDTTDSESDQSSMERKPKADDVYAGVNKPPPIKKKPHKIRDKPSPMSDEPPPLPQYTYDRQVYADVRKPSVESGSDSGEDSGAGRHRQSFGRGTVRSTNDESLYESVQSGYHDAPARVAVLPLPAKPQQHADDDNGEGNHEEKKDRRKKLTKEEKEAEKQKRKEEERLKKEEKKKQKEEEKKRREERKKKPSSGKGGVSVSYNYFGCPLEEIVTEEERVPLFLVKCIEYLEAKGLRTEGLYRVPGKNVDSDLILQRFDEDPNVDFNEINVGINAVATALKYFFNELPDPILPVHLQSEFLEAVGLPQDEEKLEALKYLLTKLPYANYDVLAFLMLHLFKITEYSDVNLMTCENLSVCWWPTLLHPDFNSFEALAQNMKMRDIVELFIMYAKYFFHPEEAQEVAEEGVK
ncbi:rho GTPase-activating protein 5-like isoform X2 [Glandiceps talaboti]